MDMGVKISCRSHKAPRNSHLAPGQIKLQTEELCFIRGELSHIKAQVDSLLESLEHMDQQKDQPAGIKDRETKGPGAEGSLYRVTEPHQEPRTQRALPEEDSSEEGTDAEPEVKNHASD
ncbi:uncharacterized protein LOC143660365 isoform X2 [Tamandua tetradactyla]